MNIYLLKQSKHRDYDTFDSCVVIAKSEKDALSIKPYDNDPDHDESVNFPSWPIDKADIQVTDLGLAHPGSERGVVCASFNAG